MNSQLSTRHSGLHLQVSFDAARQPIVREAAPFRARKGKPWKTLAAGVRIYRTTWRDQSRHKTYVSFTTIWRDATGTHREKHSNPEVAEARAAVISTSVINGDSALLEFSQADRACLLRCRELLATLPARTAPEVACGIYTEAAQILDGRSVLEACRAYAQQNPIGTVTKATPEIIEELFTRRRMGAKWRRNQKIILDRFAAKFPGRLSSLQSRELDDWLDGLKDKKQKPVGLRTRRNYLRAIEGLAHYAKDRGYLARDWSVLTQVQDPEPGRVRVDLYTPDELAALLATAEKTKSGRKLIPLITITAFAGVRHGEMNEEKVKLLDWSDLKWKSKRIHVPAEAAKTNNDRIVDMPENLLAWLEPYRRPTGKICSLNRTHDALGKLRQKAVRDLLDQAQRLTNSGNSQTADNLRALAQSLAGPKRNALRKSFISYKNALTRNIDLVADQAGNSPAMIRKNYKQTDSDMIEVAERWFTLRPASADVLPLFEWQSSRA